MSGRSIVHGLRRSRIVIIKMVFEGTKLAVAPQTICSTCLPGKECPRVRIWC